MSEITLVQVIGAAYGVSEKGLAPVGPPPSRMNTALLLIDIQQLSTADYMAKRAIDAGLPAEDVHAALADYKERFEAALSVSQGASCRGAAVWDSADPCTNCGAFGRCEGYGYGAQDVELVLPPGERRSPISSRVCTAEG